MSNFLRYPAQASASEAYEASLDAAWVPAREAATVILPTPAGAEPQSTAPHHRRPAAQATEPATPRFM